MKITEKGLVLRETIIGETSRILTLLTASHGIISASAKGSLNPKNKLFSACGLYSYSEWVLREGRSTYFADEASPIEVFFGLRENIESLSVATYIAEFLQILSPTGEESERLLNLALRSFYLLAKGRRDSILTKAVFEMRSLSESGFMPDLVACMDCGQYNTPSFLFDAKQGSLYCEACAKRRGVSPNLTLGAVEALRHIVYAGPEKIFDFALKKDSLLLLSQVTEQYVLQNLEHIPKSLDYVNSVIKKEPTE